MFYSAEPGDKLPMYTPPGDAISPQSESDIYLYLKNVRQGMFVKFDWILLNDRVLFVRMAGIDPFVSKRVITDYTKILGREVAIKLITRLRNLRRKKECSLTKGDISNLLIVDRRNTQMLFDSVTRVLVEGKFFGGYRLTLVSNPEIRRADIHWSNVSKKNMVHFFRARVGSRLVER